MLRGASYRILYLEKYRIGSERRLQTLPVKSGRLAHRVVCCTGEGVAAPSAAGASTSAMPDGPHPSPRTDFPAEVPIRAVPVFTGKLEDLKGAV